MFDVESAQLVGVGCLLADPMWEMSAHMHECWEFIYFLRGKGRVETPQATIRPQQYHVVVYPPGLLHAEASDPANPEETIFLLVRASGDPPFGAHLLLPDHRGEMGWLCQRIAAEVQMSGISRLSTAYTRAFLCLVEDAWETGLPVRHDAVDLAVQYIHANYDRAINLNELASAACVSAVHLSHTFSARLGISPLRYLRRHRIEIAKRFLVTTELPVNEVAARAGFADPFYFSRVLKSATGCSPSVYRERFKLTSSSMSGTA